MMPRIAAVAVLALAALTPVAAKADPWCGPGWVLSYGECVPYRPHHHHHHYRPPPPPYYAPSMSRVPSYGYGSGYQSGRGHSYSRY